MSDTEALIAALDPSRDYFPRTYEQVVEGIRAGQIVAAPGFNLPMLRDAQTHKAIKGSGRRLGGQNPSRWSRRHLERFAAKNIDAFEAAVLAGVAAGDPRWGKIYAEHGISKPEEVVPNLGESAMKLLMKLAGSSRETKAPEEKRITIEQEPENG